MNKIIVKNALIETDIKDDIIVNSNIGLVKKYEIIINSSCDLIVSYEDEIKLSIEYIIKENVNANIYEFRVLPKTKVKYDYILEDNANLYLYRVNKLQNMNECDIVNLNGVNSEINFNLRTLTGIQDNYDILINHNNLNTKSIVNNIGISLKGNLTFNVTGKILKGSKKSSLDQNNQIITFDASKCKINPNLLVDEYDVLATHNAFIGKFDNKIIFYLMSRGISESDAMKLIAEGLILKDLKNLDLKDEIIKITNEYWGVKK